MVLRVFGPRLAYEPRSYFLTALRSYIVQSTILRCLLQSRNNTLGYGAHSKAKAAAQPSRRSPVNQNLALSTFTRRQVLAAAAATGAAHALAPYTSAQTTEPEPSRKIEISLFSKILQWTDIKEAAAIAKDLGFDAMDLTVRPKGHVLPERVETDLPQAVKTVRRAGLHVSMISTEIASIASPYAEAMLKTASALGIRHYRWGGLTYKGSRSISEQMDALKPQVRSRRQRPTYPRATMAK